MYRARFKVNAVDPRPVLWPIQYPFWVSGYSLNNEMEAERAVVVAYVDDEDHLYRLWPDAEEVDMGEQVKEIIFSDRFTRPDWYKQDGESKTPKQEE